MFGKSSLLATLGVLALTGTALGAPSPLQHYYDRCEYIKKITNVEELVKIVRNRNDPCVPIALQRIVDLTQPAAGPVVAINIVGDAS